MFFWFRYWRSASLLLQRFIDFLSFDLFLFDLLLILEDLLCCKLKDISLRQSVFTNGSKEVFVSVKDT